MKRFLVIVILMFFVLAIAACEATPQGTKDVPTSTPQTPATATATIEPTKTLPVVESLTPSLQPTKTKRPTKTVPPTKSPTLTPSVTPTPLPTVELSSPDVLAGTPFSEPQRAISSENADQIRQLARFGRGYVNDLVYSSGGGFLAVGTTTGVYVYDRSLTEILYLETIASVEQLAFSLQSNRLAGVLNNETILEWSLEDGRILQTLEGIYVTYAPDERLLAIQQSTHDSETVQIVSFPSQTILTEIEDVYSYRKWDGFHFASDASFVLIPERLGISSLEKYSLDENIASLEFSEEGDDEGEVWENYCSGVTSMTISRNNNYVAKGCVEHGNIFIWRADDGVLVQKIGAVSWVVDALAFSPDARYIAAATELGGVGIWRISDGELLKEFPSTWGMIVSLAYSPSGEFLVAGYDNGLVRQWDVLGGSIVTDLHDYAPTGDGLDFSPEGDRLVNIAGNGVQFIDFPTGKPLKTLLAFAQSAAKRAKLVPLPLNRSGPMGRLDWMDLSQDWRHLMTWKDIGIGYLWQVEDGSLLHTFNWDEYPQVLDELRTLNPEFADYLELTGGPYHYPISPNWQYQVSRSGEMGKLSNVETGAYCGKFGSPWVSRFSPDSTLLAVPSGSGIQVYQTEDCKLVHEFWGHAAEVSALAFSHDGQILASGSADGTIMLWDLSMESLLTVVRGHAGFQDTLESRISGLTFSPDDYYLISGGLTDGTIRIWGIAP